MGNASSGGGGGGEGGKGSRPRALILEPARDLAEQTAECVKAFGKHLTPPIRSVLLVGGVDPKDQVWSMCAPSLV
jgi:ATP-dependent RNA helicase DDX1